MNNILCLSVMVVLCMTCRCVNSAGFFNWLFDVEESDHNVEQSSTDVANSAKSSVPFEMGSDEYFLQQAQLDNVLSPLDLCHHRVIAEIQGTCSRLSEEEMGKLSVELLNCQLEAEHRQTYPCTKDMALPLCTHDMDATTWNAYQIVSNRARAICYSARQQQFRMKTEFTVNKLVHTTAGQLHAMKQLQSEQDKVNVVTTNTLQQMQQGQGELIERQQTLKASQLDIHSYITGNLRELTKEKALIASGNKQLADMTEAIKNKLENATEKLNQQEKQHKVNHQEILEDLAAIREKAKEVFEKIDSSSQHVLQFHDETQQHYKETLDNLKRVNNTVNYVLDTVQDMKTSLEKKLSWSLHLLGGTGTALHLVSTLVLHIVYFLLAAISAVFLKTPMFSRVMLMLIVPLNALSEIKQGRSLGFTAMTVFITLVVATNWLVNLLTHCCLYGKKSLPQSSVSITAAPTVVPRSPNTSSDEKFENDERTCDRSSTVNGCERKDLDNKDFKRLVTVLERLYATGALTLELLNTPKKLAVQAFESEHPNPSNTPAEIGPTTQDYYNETPTKDTGATPRPQETQTTVPASPTVELVRRQLLKSLDEPTPVKSSPKRTGTPTKSYTTRARVSPYPSRSGTPVGDKLDRSRIQSSTPLKLSPTSSVNGSPRVSSSSTPSQVAPRPVCLAVTKAGLPCKMASLDGSAFCRRHQV